MTLEGMVLDPLRFWFSAKPLRESIVSKDLSYPENLVKRNAQAKADIMF
jgi:hypothetical protein